MQVYPMNFVYASICAALFIPCAMFSVMAELTQTQDNYSSVAGLIAILLAIIGIGFLIAAINIEVWDSCYRRL